MVKLTDTEFIAKHIANGLRRFMSEKNISMTQVAEKLGVSIAVISTTVNGKSTSTNSERYEKIANAIGMPKAEFDSLVSEAKKHEFKNSHWTDINEAANEEPESVDAAFMARHHIPDAKKRDLMRFLQAIREEDE